MVDATKRVPKASAVSFGIANADGTIALRVSEGVRKPWRFVVWDGERWNESALRERPFQYVGIGFLDGASYAVVDFDADVDSYALLTVENGQIHAKEFQKPKDLNRFVYINGSRLVGLRAGVGDRTNVNLDVYRIVPMIQSVDLVREESYEVPRSTVMEIEERTAIITGHGVVRAEITHVGTIACTITTVDGKKQLFDLGRTSAPNLELCIGGMWHSNMIAVLCPVDRIRGPIKAIHSWDLRQISVADGTIDSVVKIKEIPSASFEEFQIGWVSPERSFAAWRCVGR
jgi:hypothetical protein